MLQLSARILKRTIAAWKKKETDYLIIYELYAINS